MAVFRGTIRSEALQMDTNVNVIIPEAQFYGEGYQSRTLILLHGLKQNADAWLRMSRAEHHAARAGFNLVLPEVQRSFYTDTAGGLRYFEYISEELPRLLSAMFRIPADREHLMIGGLSMGGFGAVKCALNYPERFSAAMSFSGALRFMEYGEARGIMFPGEMKTILGETLACPENGNIPLLLKKAADAPQRPRLYFACGTEDGLLHESREMSALAASLGYDCLFEEWAGGHEWGFWDRALARGMSRMSGIPVRQIDPLCPEEI